MNYQKYSPPPPIGLEDRQWPDKEIKEAPIWCSVDLRDGNQALERPMTLEQKIYFYQHLVDIGFKEIEIGFPAASDTEFEFSRYLIDNHLIPKDVTIQVLTQARSALIERTMEAVRGAPNVILHLYNSTSTLQRDVVFKMNEEEVQNLAVQGAKMLVEAVSKDRSNTKYRYEYSPESFSGTEPDYAVSVCDAVVDVFKPHLEDNDKIIINLPNTVEMGGANYYADQVEYFCRHTRHLDDIIISLHPHNDRGQAVAASELGLLAGGQRVEGTLFGNGERTGNADLLTMAMNLFSHGIDPKLDFSNINKSIQVYEASTGILVHPRHPYAGDLVYTAFSGSHQDAIRKGMLAREVEAKAFWAIPYLPIDPMDVGRDYAPIIRINSQSGKGGVAWIMEQYYSYQLPRGFQQVFSADVKRESERRDKDLRPDEILDLFHELYVDLQEPLRLTNFNELTLTDKSVAIDAEIDWFDSHHRISAEGSGVLEAFNNALNEFLSMNFEILEYQQHALTQSSASRALSYVTMSDSKGEIREIHQGAGTSSNITKSSLRALVSAYNRAYKAKHKG